MMLRIGLLAVAGVAAAELTVHEKIDFDFGESSFRAEGQGEVTLDDRPTVVLGVRSLHVRRASPGGYFGAAKTVEVPGPSELRIAFCVRARGMEGVTVNFFDEIAGDNTTPAVPVLVRGDGWRPVVLHVPELHHNSAPPERKLAVPTLHTRLLFHGPELEGQQGEFWIDRLVVYRGPDIVPPEVPGNLRAEAQGGDVRLSWSEAKDDTFAAVYGVFRRWEGAGWEKIAESVLPRYSDAVPGPGRYEYRVVAADYENNLSGPSEIAAVIVASGGARRVEEEVVVSDRRAYAEVLRKVHAAGAGKVRRDVFLAFGDSITAANVYTYALASALGRGIFVRHGYGGMRTDFAEARIEELLDEVRPEFAVVMFGTNDSKDPESVRRAMDHLARVIEACAERGTVAILATIPPRGYERAQEGERRYNAALVELCRSRRVPVSYVFEEMIEGNLRELLGDGVHLTPGPGNAAAAEALRKTFEQVEFALRDLK